MFTCVYIFNFFTHRKVSPVVSEIRPFLKTYIYIEVLEYY